MTDPFQSLNKLGEEFSEKQNADIAILFGNLIQSHAKWVIQQCSQRKRRPSLILVLATRGGDASAAYRIGRAIQELYPAEADESGNLKSQFTVFLPGLCKSAGTILAIAASTIIMSELAELGPIDVQLRDPLEVGEITSSLTPIQALDNLGDHAKTLFRQLFRDFRFETAQNFPTGLAAQLATEITVGLMTPVYAQVDPLRLAEVERSLKISSEYADRLISANPLISNLKDQTISRLLGSYPSHGFVIDRKEAKSLFDRVEEPSPELSAIARDANWLERWFVDQDKGPYFEYICPEQPAKAK